MRKLLLIAFATICWIVLLTAIVTTIARVSTVAKERRQNSASHFTKDQALTRQ